jgi:putative endopeptidase
MGKTNKLKILNNISNKTKKIYKKLTPKNVKSTILVNNRPICTNKYKSFETDLAKMNNLNYLNNNANDVIKKFKKAVSYKLTNPKDDFYTYINEKWLNSPLTKEIEYAAQLDDFRIVQDKVYRSLNEILIEEFTNPETKNTKKSIEIKNTYNSLLKLNNRQQQQCVAKNITLLFDELRKNQDNLWEIMAFLNSNELTSIGCPFIWKINPDDLNPTIYKSFLEPPSVSLIDTSIYFEDGKNVVYKEKFKKRYLEYLNQLFVNAFGKKHTFNVENIFDCEQKILVAMGCNVMMKVTANGRYNLITKEEAINRYHFNWKEFTKKLGFIGTPESFVTSNPNYLSCGTKMLLEEWNSEKWREYWIYLYIRQQQRFSQCGHENYYDFYGKYQSGLKGIFDETLRPIFMECFFFNTFLTNSYVEKNKNKEIENYVMSMAEDLRIVFAKIIQKNTWIRPTTKKKALNKLSKIRLLLGSQHELIDDPLLDYKSDDAWGNIVKKSLWRHKLAVDFCGKKIKDIPAWDWNATPPQLIGTQAYSVNARYIPTKNTVFVSLGYLQSPFIDLTRGIEYNLARIGFTIAHEMSHALDDFGSKYDENGVYVDWWTTHDKKKFERIQNDIIKQYELFALRDGIKFDARPTIGEDLADLSGLLICLEYLLDLHLINRDILPEQELSFELFFVHFAIQQKQKISKKALFAQLSTNPHPLDKYRTNIPLSRSVIFRTIYNISKKDKMWWHNMNKVWLDFNN